MHQTYFHMTGITSVRTLISHTTLAINIFFHMIKSVQPCTLRAIRPASGHEQGGGGDPQLALHTLIFTHPSMAPPHPSTAQTDRLMTDKSSADMDSFPEPNGRSVDYS